ncbi:hypothetical protein PENTCL1PPCAC_573, partial [Pristionchus entomophagus]
SRNTHLNVVARHSLLPGPRRGSLHEAEKSDWSSRRLNGSLLRQRSLKESEERARGLKPVTASAIVNSASLILRVVSIVYVWLSGL